MTNFNEITSADAGLEVSQESSSIEERSPKKFVHFADSKGLALTSTYFFATENNFCLNHWAAPKGVCLKRQSRAISTNANGINCPITKFLNFKPSPSPRRLQETLERQSVCLEQIMFCDKGICGRVKVRNLAFEKKVFVRYTFDSWSTYEEETATYVPGSSSGFTDTFAFRIQFTQDSCKSRMEFAICYKLGEDHFWDNNYGDNYRLTYV